MLRLVVVIVTVVMVSGQFPTHLDHKFCCSPHKWETFVWGIGGANAPNRAEKLGDTVWITGFMSFDSHKQKAYSFINTTVGEYNSSIKTIEDLKCGHKFTIDMKKNTCVKSNVTGPAYYGCVPDNAVNLTRVYYGLGNDSFYMDIYKYWVMTGGMALEVYLSVTADDCLRVSESIRGAGNYRAVAMTLNYLQTTKGIKDDSVFDVPDICKQSAIPGPPVSRLESLFGIQ